MYYEIQRECEYKNILVLINDISRIDLPEFVFGLNSVLISEDNDEAIKNLENLYKHDWHEIIRNQYKSKVHLSEYDFCDYIVGGEKFVSAFFMLDTEKINRINLHMYNNRNKPIGVICNKDIFNSLKLVLPTVNIMLVDLAQV